MGRKWLGIFIVLLAGVLFWFWKREEKPKPVSKNLPVTQLSVKDPLWSAPDSIDIPHNDTGDLIRYGRKLISKTSIYYGPHGSVGHNTNGMNCQNCHLNAGTVAWAGNFGSVASLYPRFGDRRGSTETINQRITDCFERSMNGKAPDSNGIEMRAMNAYIRWVGKDVIKGKKPRGTGLEQLSFIERAADPQRGRAIYIQKCQLCHGINGKGKLDSPNSYLYPPLWGDDSYNTAAGLYRLSKFAGFIKDNMPFGSSYVNEHLTTEEAWDIAAFVNSQPRPAKKFRQDWPNILLKPVDLPDGPFPDSYPAIQHKYGPFAPIAKYKKDIAANSKN
jgi:thiosulfate dehydrogenase